MVQFPWSSAKTDEDHVYSENFDTSPAAAIDAVRNELATWHAVQHYIICHIISATDPNSDGIAHNYLRSAAA